MTISTIGWQAYQRIRDYKISDPDVTAALTARGATEPTGGWTLGQVSSWGRWGPPENLCEPITANSPQDFAALAPMTTSIMFLSLNWGGERPPIDAPIWANFHKQGHGGDTRLANNFRTAMQLTGFTAAPYMSDVFKLIPSPRSTDLTRILREEEAVGRDPIGRCINLLREELMMCRAANNDVDPTIVAIGHDAYRWLTGTTYGKPATMKPTRVSMALTDWLGCDATSIVRWIPHHSGAVWNEDFQRALIPIFRHQLEE